MLVAPDAFLDELHRQNPDLASQGLTDTDLRVTTYVACGLIMAWSAAAAALAVLAWRRVRWAATGLAVSAGLASVLCLLSVVGAVVAMLVPLAACAVTVALLVRPESLAWFRARRSVAVVAQALRSASASRATPSSITSRVLQNANRTRSRPPSGSAWSS